MYRVLFVDDDENILKINRAYFEPRGFSVETCDDPVKAVQLVKETDFDCIVLDIIMPNGNDGYTICESIKNISKSPVIFLTSLTEKDFLYHGFSCGADDYITKPYDLQELLYRVESRIKNYRGRIIKSEIFTYIPLEVDITSRKAEMNGEELLLTSGEFDILSFLCANPNAMFSAEEIYQKVWKMPSLDSAHTVQVHISHLRRKLEKAYPDHKFIQTVWGKGYIFVPSPDKKS